jgi:hypothetical protein
MLAGPQSQSVVKEPLAYSTGQTPMLTRTLPDGNRALSIGGNTLRTNLSESDLEIKRNVDALNNKVASMNPADITPEQRARIQGIREQAGYMRGGVNNTGQAIARPTGADVLAGRQPGQAVRYNRGGLSVEFAPNTSNQEIADFTGTHRGLVGARQEQEKIDAAQAAKLQAMNGGRGPGPDMPEMPDLSGLGPDEIKAQVAAYSARQSAYDNWHQNATQAENYQGQNANQSQQNQLAAQNALGEREGQALDNQQKQYGFDRQKQMDSILDSAANAVPGTPDGDKTIADARRRWAELNPSKETPDSVMAIEEGQHLVSKKDGSPIGGGQKPAQGAVPPVNERVAGKTTTSINGQNLVWNGKGWVINQ